MKRILVIALLGGVLISTIGVTMAVGERNPTITRAIFGSNEAGSYIYSAVGIITFNTETGDWTIKTYGPLPYSDFDYYYPSITLCAPDGRYINCYSLPLIEGISTYVVAVDGRIEASGRVGPDLLEDINLLLEDRSVFILTTNNV